ncbi:MAG: DUF4430 domain-containing protein [Methanobacteriota archaeon]
MRVAVLVALVAVSGCVRFDGDGRFEVDLLVTRDFGATVLRHETVAIWDGATAIDAVREVASVETSYGGGFVRGIDGLVSRFPDEREDWFYEVDGALCMVGAASRPLAAGERLHWDFRAWNGSEAPGLFNTFPWGEARVLVTADAPSEMPASLAPRAEPWTGEWPAASAPAVLVTGPNGAPWEVIPWGSGLDVETPWALASRVGPECSARAVFVLAGATIQPPERGLAWLASEDGLVEVRP